MSTDYTAKGISEALDWQESYYGIKGWTQPFSQLYHFGNRTRAFALRYKNYVKDGDEYKEVVSHHLALEVKGEVVSNEKMSLEEIARRLNEMEATNPYEY